MAETSLIERLKQRFRGTPVAEPAPEPERRARRVDVGWLIDTPSAGFIWDAPKRLKRERPEQRHPKALTQCPALVDHEARLFEVACPIDLQLGIAMNPPPGPQGQQQGPALINLARDQASIRSKHLNQICRLVDRKEWSHPNRPVVQIITPYICIADEPVYLEQLYPFHHYRPDPWPGLLVGGRFPIDVWPRPLMWAFEWYDVTKPIVLKRGEPWFYLRFEIEDPSRPVRLIEAAMTPELREYMSGLNGVTNYVGQTFQLFATARERRPKQLLVEKVRS